MKCKTARVVRWSLAAWRFTASLFEMIKLLAEKEFGPAAFGLFSFT